MSSPVTLLVLAHITQSARAADYTGDGFDDLVIGVPHEGLDGLSNVGGIEVVRGSAAGLTSPGDAFLHQNTTGVDASNGSDLFGYALAAGDIDGDGVDDIVVGGPHEPIRATQCGAIWRLELTPSATSLSVTESQLFSQYTTGVADSCESGDDFGSAVAVADFDGDGYDDVVVGVPGEDIGTGTDVGALHYLRGSSAGLTTSGQAYYYQDVTDVEDTSETADAFGSALAAGDFDGDGYADLAVGVPGEDGGVAVDSGAVHVLYGTAAGPGAVSPDDDLWFITGGGAEGTECGTALAVGDFDADGYDDLAIGCPNAVLYHHVGSVWVVYGSVDGLDASEVWEPGWTPDEQELYGYALSSGDYDGDGYDDLAIGAPQEDTAVPRDPGNGAVHVLSGASGGLTSTGEVLLAQDLGSTVLGSPSAGEDWGSALASGDYDGDGLDDLAVGAHLDADSGATEGGVVNVFYGSATGPSTTGDRMLHQNTSGIEDTVESGDWFGFSLR